MPLPYIKAERKDLPSSAQGTPTARLVRMASNDRKIDGAKKPLDKFPHGFYNGRMNVYLDYAATTPLDEEVLQAMLPLLKQNFGNPDSLHAHGRQAAKAVTDARDEIAHTLGVSPEEVYFTSGGTEADNWAVRGIGEGRALLSSVEHAAVLSAASLRKGGSALFPVGKDGIAHVGALETALGEGAGLVCLMAANNETGTIQPLREVSELCRKRGVPLFSDCVQAACALDLNEIARLADAFSVSAHKFGGPKGAGALIVRRGVRLRPLIAGGEQERSLRGGTLNVAGAVGLAAALSKAQRERRTFAAHTEALRDLFEREVLAALGEDVTVDGAARLPNLSHLTFRRGGPALLSALDLNGLSCSGGAACSAHADKPSHVMTAMGRSEDEARRGIRFSFGMRTTEEETRFAAATLIRLYRTFF